MPTASGWTAGLTTEAGRVGSTTRQPALSVQVQNTAGGVNGVSALTFRSVEAQKISRPQSWDDGDKEEICHVPSGNPRRSHTIVVDVASVDAHLAHGDYRGRCDRDDSDDDDDDDD